MTTFSPAPLRLARSARAFLSDEQGATSIEYALIASLIALVIIGGVSALGTSVVGLFDTTADAVPQ